MHVTCDGFEVETLIHVRIARSGLDVADRIVLHVTGIDDLADGFATLASEVLAVEVITGTGWGEGTVLELDDERDARAWVAKD